MRSFRLVLASLCCASVLGSDWSFKDFFVGEWDMERHIQGGKVEYAHYSLSLVGAALEGTYHEDGEDGPTAQAKVKVTFDDFAGKVGEFHLGKIVAPKPQQQGEDPPTPQKEPEEPKLMKVFDFDFRAQSDLRFHLSESVWLGGKGGTVQFLAAEDSFVFTKVGLNTKGDAPQPVLSSWTAVRRGAPRKPRSGGDGKRSMLSRYGWYVGLGFMYVAYKAATAKAAAMVGGAAKKTK